VLNSILETCQLAIGPHKKPGVPGEGKEDLACRKAAHLSPRQTKPAHMRAHGVVVCR